MDAARLQGLVKPLLHAVLKKVHPDFFTHQPAAKAANQSAVQRLQGLLAPVLAPGSPSRDHGTADRPLEFVVRDGSETLQTVSFAFSSRRARAGHELQAQRARDMLGLCSALGVAPSTTITQEIEEAIGPAARQPADGNAVARLRAARAREALLNYTRSRTAHDTRAAMMDGLRRAAWPPGMNGAKAGQLEPKLDRSKIFFAADVAPQQYMDVVRHIEGQLRDLDYACWCALPVMVVSSWKDALRRGTSRYPGFVVIPRNVEAKAFLRYLRENLDEIRRARQASNARQAANAR
ncbi:hypothetical protein LPJ61_000588 [Coemansia biformis]|uniref:DUF4460 domain-containing protein n=1 Tax=Coemansia biformis TaxID=1286918 RepID=A0A9W7YGH3_9FUNG|nr:hypothetical protein LPJ61_000588 [Coemansia biformis]